MCVVVIIISPRLANDNWQIRCIAAYYGSFKKTLCIYYLVLLKVKMFISTRNGE